jgi:isopenicillin N synthase-like dioxygenase
MLLILLDPQHRDSQPGADISRDVQLSCGEHTNYGLLTLVNQEGHVSALQVRWWGCTRLGVGTDIRA